MRALRESPIPTWPRPPGQLEPQGEAFCSVTLVECNDIGTLLKSTEALSQESVLFKVRLLVCLSTLHSNLGSSVR